MMFLTVNILGAKRHVVKVYYISIFQHTVSTETVKVNTFKILVHANITQPHNLPQWNLVINAVQQTRTLLFHL